MKQQLPIIGWREHLTLPDLGIQEVKAKIDTGARTSALHAFDVEIFTDQGKQMVSFKMHPLQRDTSQTVTAVAELLEQRKVRNSGGQTTFRPVILTTVELNLAAAGGTQAHRWLIELTLINRDLMSFRMLLGRQAVRQRFLVDAGKSYLHTSTVSRKLKNNN
ncbi:MAG: ATP-dependent zinc protease [Coleofasciculaceae cyanobacterium]